MLLPVTFKAENFGTRLKANLAVVHHNSLLAVSVAGPITTIKAIHAGLQSGKMQIAFPDRSSGFFSDLFGGAAASSWAVPHRDRFAIHQAHLGFDSYHLLAVSKWNRFLLHSDSDEALWSMLRSDEFTTPILRQWIPGLREMLENGDLLQKAESFGCSASVLLGSDGYLDKMVSEGLKTGRLRMPAGQKAVA